MRSVNSTINLRQVRTLTSASIRSRYRNSWAGLLWVVLSPILMFAAQAYAFKIVLKVQVDNYYLFLLTGLLPWIFLSQSIVMSTTLFMTNARMFKSFPIHPVSSLIAVVADNLINFVLATVIIIITFLALASRQLPLHLVLFPIPFLAVFIATVAMSWLLATSQVFFADTKFVFDFVLTIAFYITPIFYPLDFVAEPYRTIVRFNPMSILILPLQMLSRDELSPDYFLMVMESFGLAIVLLVFAYWNWKRVKNQLYFRL